MRTSDFDSKTTIRGKVPRIPFMEMKREVLGSQHELSLVLCGDKLSRTINKKYRNKTYAANVLSFPLNTYEGEMFLNIRAAEREAKKYAMSLAARLALLYVHGLFHLKGFDHGTKMEKRERQVLKKFGFSPLSP